MFHCQLCREKKERIDFLEKQNKDLLDRLMSFNPDTLMHYKAETKSGEPLYPVGVDEKGKLLKYEDVNLEEANADALRAMSEQPITIEDKNG